MAEARPKRDSDVRNAREMVATITAKTQKNAPRERFSFPSHLVSDIRTDIIERIYRRKPFGHISIHPAKNGNKIVMQTR